jgi:hypothetical protein
MLTEDLTGGKDSTVDKVSECKRCVTFTIPGILQSHLQILKLLVSCN